MMGVCPISRSFTPCNTMSSFYSLLDFARRPNGVETLEWLQPHYKQALNTLLDTLLAHRLELLRLDMFTDVLDMLDSFTGIGEEDDSGNINPRFTLLRLIAEYNDAAHDRLQYDANDWNTLAERFQMIPDVTKQVAAYKRIFAIGAYRRVFTQHDVFATIEALNLGAQVLIAALPAPFSDEATGDLYYQMTRVYLERNAMSDALFCWQGCIRRRTAYYQWLTTTEASDGQRRAAALQLVKTHLEASEKRYFPNVNPGDYCADETMINEAITTHSVGIAESNWQE